MARLLQSLPAQKSKKAVSNRLLDSTNQTHIPNLTIHHMYGYSKAHFYGFRRRYTFFVRVPILRSHFIWLIVFYLTLNYATILYIYTLKTTRYVYSFDNNS